MDFEGIFTGVEKRLNETIEVATKEKVKEVEAAGDAKITELNEILGTGAKLTVTTDTTKATVKGLKHKQLKDLILMIGQRMPVLMVGMAGTGKTHAAAQTAEALKLPFYSMSVGAQTSKSDIIGYMHAGGGYVATLFRKAYETGGVFLMDEIDAGNANVLIQINSALSNEYCAFPDAMVQKHADFAFIATANTYGNGANRQYVGRNQLDAATLDRFTVLGWEIDNALEKALVKNYANGERWHKTLLELRKYVDKQTMRVLVTPRATLRGTLLLESGFPFEQVVDMAVLHAFPSDKQKNAMEMMQKAWGPKPIAISAKARNAELKAGVEVPDITEFMAIDESTELKAEDIEKAIEELEF